MIYKKVSMNRYIRLIRDPVDVRAHKWLYILTFMDLDKEVVSSVASV